MPWYAAHGSLVYSECEPLLLQAGDRQTPENQQLMHQFTACVNLLALLFSAVDFAALTQAAYLQAKGLRQTCKIPASSLCSHQQTLRWIPLIPAFNRLEAPQA